MNHQHLLPEETCTPSLLAVPLSTPNPQSELDTHRTPMAAIAPVQQISSTQALETADIQASDSYLLPLLNAEARQHKRDTYVSLAMSLFFLVSILWATTQAGVDSGNYTLHLLQFLALMILLVLTVSTRMLWRAKRRKQALARELEKPHAVSMVGSLLDAARVDNTEVRSLSKQALIRLLPQLQASDAAELTDTHRDRMLRLLAISPQDTGYRDLKELFSQAAYRREVALRVAILKAYEQVGGAKELADVERLAKGSLSWRSPARVPPEIQQAAAECLPSLRPRASDEQASEQLLRASCAQAASPEVLLRPATAIADAAPETLLRASESTS